jgi:Zn-dependent peptidase ImmA (M78 family)
MAVTLKDFGIKLIYKPLKNIKGYFNPKTCEIAIDTKQSKWHQDSVLIHEFLHATAHSLLNLGVIKKHPDHKFIANCSQQLLGLLVASGKWKTKHKIILK